MKNDFSAIKCVAFDLDGTVINSDKSFSDRTIAAFDALQKRGICLLPVSGRAWSSFPDSVLKLPSLSYAVTSNGVAVYDVRTGKRVHGLLLNASDVRVILKSIGNFFLEGQVTYEAFIDGVPYAAEDYVNNPVRYGIPRESASYIHQTRKPCPFIIDFVFEHAGEMDCLDIILKDAGLYRMVENTIRHNVEDCYITSSVPYRMEISNPDSGKAPGMLNALKLLDVLPEETIAFGDADNDASMLASAGIGVAMKDATDSCRENADFVTELSAQEDGVAEFIEKNFL